MTLPPLGYLNLVSNVLPMGVGLIRVRRMKGPIVLFFIFVAFSGATELTSFLLAMRSIHNLWLVDLYHLVEYVLLTIVLTSWRKDGLLRRVERLAILGYGLFWLVAKSTFEPFGGAGQVTSTIASIFILCSAIVTMFQLVQDEESNYLNDCKFWIIAGVLLYIAGNLLLFTVFEKFALLTLHDALTVWSVHWGINILVNIVYTISFLLIKR